MNLFRFETIGAIDGLGVREEAIPVPSAGEVLIRVKASALNSAISLSSWASRHSPCGPESFPSLTQLVKWRRSALTSPH